jgi:hypothetical protein
MVSTFRSSLLQLSLFFLLLTSTLQSRNCHLSCIWVIYCGTVTVQFIWNFQSKEPTKQALEETECGNTSSKIGMGPVFSSLAMSEEGIGEEGTLEAIHACAREGDLQGLSQLLDLGIPVDLKESHGRTPLIWAADRGQLSAVEILLAKGAEINAQVCLKREFVYMLDLESRSCIFRQN